MGDLGRLDWGDRGRFGTGHFYLWSGVIQKKGGINLVGLMFHHIQGIEMLSSSFGFVRLCFRLNFRASGRGLLYCAGGIGRGQNGVVGGGRWGADIWGVFPGAWE